MSPREQYFEVQWVIVVAAIFGLFGWGFMYLAGTKLDKAVFEEHQRLIQNMSDDIKAIRAIVDSGGGGRR